MQVPQEITKMVHKLGPIGLTQGIKDTLDALYSRKVEIKSSNEKQQRVVDNGGKKYTGGLHHQGIPIDSGVCSRPLRAHTSE